MNRISVQFRGSSEPGGDVYLDHDLASIFSNQERFIWPDVGMVRMVDDTKIVIDLDHVLADDRTRDILTQLQLVLLLAETARMKISAIPGSKHLDLGRSASRVDLFGGDGTFAICGMWNSWTDEAEVRRFAGAKGMAVIHWVDMLGPRPGTISAFVHPPFAAHMTTVMTAAKHRGRDIYYIGRGYRGQEDADICAAEDERQRAQDAEDYRNQARFGEEGIVTEWGRFFIRDHERYAEMIPVLRTLDELGRESCIGVTGNGFRTGEPPPFTISAERALIKAWQIGRHGEEQAGRLKFTHVPADIRLVLKERAHAVVGVTSRERRAGDFATTRAIMRAVALEAWTIGNAMARDETPDLYSRYREECCSAMRIVPSSWRKCYLDASVSGKPVSWSVNRPSNRFPSASLDVLVAQGLMDKDEHLTPAGKDLATAERTWQAQDHPSILGLAILTPRLPETGKEPVVTSSELAVTPAKPETIVAPAWRTIPDNVAEGLAFLSSALRLLPEVAPDLLPAAMTIVSDQETIVVQLKGCDVLRLEWCPDGAGTLVVDDLSEAPEGQVLREERGLCCRLRREANGDHVQLLEEGRVIAVSEADPPQDGKGRRIRGFRPVLPEAALPETAVAIFVNWAIQRRMNGFPQLAGVPLRDGLKFVHGSEDARLVGLLARLEANLRYRLADDVEPPEDDPVRRAVDEFFSP
ncbi:hypothetical protein LAZ40_05635 [Cereibacter sphaeroides]|uniref:hypothetical protein n=1 Tax=Cereibacter sphaeroides TaxID=1063 RepID=UPI001F477E3A|nr:hypothetical protein [Cereibacter sphaeroides]MCE6958531.1 hypothetical protein [Cereibacter sphaeroides]MCE6972806.1 hypothetical protein [Cereibacter sphaeroides]